MNNFDPNILVDKLSQLEMNIKILSSKIDTVDTSKSKFKLWQHPITLAIISAVFSFLGMFLAWKLELIKIDREANKHAMGEILQKNFTQLDELESLLHLMCESNVITDKDLCERSIKAVRNAKGVSIISGVMIDGVSNKSLPGVKVNLLINDKKFIAETNSNGFFHFQIHEQEASEVLIKWEKSGYISDGFSTTVKPKSAVMLEKIRLFR